MRLLMAIVLVGLGLGCRANSVRQVGERPRETISYAATATYPGNAQTAGAVQAVAINRPGDRLEIHNLGPQGIPSTAVWVNGSYVRQIAEIPAGGSVEILYGELLDAGKGTSDLRAIGATPSTVELQTADGLYTVQGPIRSR